MLKPFFLILPLLALAAPAAGGEAPWEPAVDARVAELAAAGGWALPTPLPEGEPEAPEGRPHLAMARSTLRLLGGVDSTTVALRQDPLPALSLARNLHHLGFGPWSLAWYERAEVADGAGRHDDSIPAEKLRLEVALADSARALELTCAACQGGADTTLLLELVALCRRFPPGPGSEILARALAASPARDAAVELVAASLYRDAGRPGPALPLYVSVVRQPGDLGLSERARALKGLADTLFLLGRRREAAGLYARYRSHDTGLLGAWSTYQLGVLAVSAGRHAEAEELFQSLCEREQETPWREAACDRLALGRELGEIDAALKESGRGVPLR